MRFASHGAEAGLAWENVCVMKGMVRQLHLSAKVRRGSGVGDGGIGRGEWR